MYCASTPPMSSGLPLCEAKYLIKPGSPVVGLVYSGLIRGPQSTTIPVTECTTGPP